MLPYKLQEGAEYKGGLVNINNCTVATRVYLVNTSKHKPHTSSEYTTVRNVYYFWSITANLQGFDGSVVQSLFDPPGWPTSLPRTSKFYVQMF